jgi:transcriptional regulator with XRE-family HTH domain
MDLVTAFGRNVKAARERRNLTQEDLEGLTGLRRSYVSDLERGTRNPTVRALERLAVALQVLPAELLSLPDDATWPPISDET